MFRRWFLLFFVCLFVFIFSIGTVFAFTLTDMAGRRISLPSRANRIVCSGPGALRLVVYMRAAERVVGVEDFEKKRGAVGRPYILAHRELLKLPSIGRGGPQAIGEGPNLEKTLKLHPDVIIATYMSADSANALQQKLGIPVVVLSYGKLATFTNRYVFRSLQILGEVLGDSNRANSIVSFIRNNVSYLQHKTADISESKKVGVYVGGIGHKGMHGIESTMGKYPPFQVVNARNVVDSLGVEGWVSVDREKILVWNPDVVFIDEGGISVWRLDYKSHPDFYRSLKAFKRGKVYGLLPYNFYTTNIGTALSDAYYVGKILYPDIFSSVEPIKKADDTYKFLVGKPVYSRMEADFGGFKRVEVK
ncbi:MAG: iron ABC transporter substrate-binding protein [Synergistetes bacterium]|nr:iron ABC transporter substrate-binding protein [Synergistota bacterium]